MSIAVVANVAGIALWSLAGALAAGLACVAYGALIERRWYRVKVRLVPVVRGNGGEPITILHLSDLHMVAGDRGKARFMATIDRPDVCVVTGDILGEPEAVDACVAALRPVRGRLASYFVFGSNDYYAPRPLSYLSYFRKRRPRRVAIRSRSDDLRAGLEADGWAFLSNRKLELSANGVRMEVAGLDDPHIERHDLRVARREDPAAIGLAVVHSPDPAPELAALGYDVVLCGHTHGGQVRMPLAGALVTNSTIPTRLCMGLSRFGRSYVHVSPGLGTSKYAPFRFLCRPEATILRLVPAAQPSESTRANADS